MVKPNQSWYADTSGPHPCAAQLLALEAALAHPQHDSGRDASLRRIAVSLEREALKLGIHALAHEARQIAIAPVDKLGETTRRLLENPPRAPQNVSEVTEILIVEDNATMAAAVGAYLRAPDRAIRIAQSASEAVRLLAEKPADLLILDLVLPDRDGRDLLVELRSDPATADMPVIVLSAKSDDVARTESLAVGADEFVLKPADPTDLRATVQRALEGDPTTVSSNDDPAPGPEGEIEAEGARPVRILLVEDDRVTATLVHHRLTRAGFEVFDFLNGSDGHRWAEGVEFDGAVLDIQVPGMGGFELLERIRAMPHVEDVPVVMLTSLGHESQVVRALDLGANDYIHKPFSPSELVARVRRLVTRNMIANADTERALVLAEGTATS